MKWSHVCIEKKKLKNNTCKICWKSLCSGILLFGSFVSLSHLMWLQRDTVFAIPNNTTESPHDVSLRAETASVSHSPCVISASRGTLTRTDTLFQGKKKKRIKPKIPFRGPTLGFVTPLPNSRLCCLFPHPTLPLIIRTFNASYGLGTKVAVEVSHFQKWVLSNPSLDRGWEAP